MVLGHEWETGGTETSDSGGENGGGGREEPTAGNRRVRQTKGLNGNIQNQSRVLNANPRITINATRSKPEGILKKIGSPKQGYNEKREIETKRYNGKKSDRNT